MVMTTQTMLYLSELYFIDGNDSYRFQWTNQIWIDKNIHPGEPEDDSEYYQALAKYNYISNHLNDGSDKAASYRINIYDRDSEEKIFTAVTGDFSINVELENGEYLWEIQALDGNGNVITTSEKSYVNTEFDDWEDDATISYRDSSSSHQLGEVGDVCGNSFPDKGCRVAWAGRIISGEKDSNFMVCGPADCGNESAWEFSQDAGFTYSIANAFGGFDGEFPLCDDVLITCSGLYEYENGQWNYKIFTAPWVCGPKTGSTDKAYFFVDGENTIYEWNSDQDKIAEVLTAAKEIYDISDYYYVTQDGVFSIKNKSTVVDYDVQYGEHLVFDDLFFNIYAENSAGEKVDVLETGEKGSVIVQYYFFDKKNDKVIDKKITLWKGTAPFLIDAEEIYDARVGNCIGFAMQDENDEMESDNAYVYIHEICEDGTVKEYSSTCNTWDDVMFSTDGNGCLICEYGGSQRIFNDIKPVFSELSFTVPKIMAGDQTGISFKDIPGSERIAAYSADNFASQLLIDSESDAIDTFGLPAGNYSLRISGDDGKSWLECQDIVATGNNGPQKFTSDADGNMDLFFGNAKDKWESEYAAQHQGMLGWSGTGELVQLNGKNKILDIFSGSADANILVLTDDANGDALFVEDIYTSFGKDAARFSQINEIRAGAGDDIVDMTSQRYAYDGEEMTICGGDGNDVIWAAGSDNDLFGDAGNDRIVGSTGFDLIVGGAGNDSMHSGGGNDIFAFCENWGVDTVEITDNAYITLWFASGNASNWDAGKRVYRDGSNSVTVIGGANSTIDLKFGNAGGQYSDMVDIGAFESAASEKIFEDKNNGMLA